MKVVLDTCAIIWAISEPESLSSTARRTLSAKDTEVLVSPISCAEIACAVERGKVVLDRHWKLWFRSFVEKNGWRVVPIDLPIIEESYSLPEPFHRDPADRVIVATARIFQGSVVTADSKLRDYPHVEVCW